MLNFLENNLKLNASGLNIGSGATLTTNLTLDQRNIIPATFTVTVPPNGDASVPYSATLIKITDQICQLTITFDQPIANVHFGENRTLVISSTSGNFNLNVEINYTNAFSSNNWTNTTASLTIDDVDFKSPLNSTSINNRLLSLLHSAITSLNQIKNYIQYYSFKEKYLSDIIDFALASGNSMEPSTTTITTNANNNITSILKVYATGRNRTERILITYTYNDYDLIRLRKRDSVYTELYTDSINLLSSFTVDAVDSSNNLIYRLGTITINRSLSSEIYSNPFLFDYNDSLPIEIVDKDPDNILSDYKYYKTYGITGWTVV